MPDYQQGKIYKLWSPSKNLVYYGSTTQSLATRLGGHLRGFKQGSKIRSYLVLECEDYKIELIEEFPCNNKKQLEAKEKEYIINNECVNKNHKNCGPWYSNDRYLNNGWKEQKKEYYQKKKYEKYSDEDANKIYKLENELNELKQQLKEKYK